jgi:hypothetical protein
MPVDAPTKLDALPFPDSICPGCANSRIVATKTSKFLLCTALTTKYPRQPIVKCPAFEADRRR